jgi:hypothetical protein
MQGLTRYGFSQAASGFFEFPTENARRILPPHIEPVELHHGSSIFSMTAFDFTESMVGPYGEVVMSVIVSPLVKPGKPLPKSAFYPYLVGTTTRAAREHAIERWHLPHWMADVEMQFAGDGRQVTARVSADGEPVAEMTISQYEWHPVSHLYQSFMHDQDGTYLANITMEGEHSEHEEETGRIKLFPHAFHKQLALSEVSETPFREMWMRKGLQTFEPLIQLETA